MSNHRATYGRLTRAAGLLALAFAGLTGVAMADGNAESVTTYTYQTLDVPGSIATVALGINDVGQIAGYWFDSVGHIHSFVQSQGKYATFDMPGAANTYATAINNFGVVAGEWQDTSGHRHGMVATPRLGHSH